MKIGQVARETGLSVKTIRYYHDIKLVEARRGDNGYREYQQSQLAQLHFVARCKALGFSLEQCAQLLSLNARQDRTAAAVKSVATEQLLVVQEKVHQLQQLERQLSTLVSACDGSDRPECAILDSLNGSGCSHE